jgi:hypothetical protein
MNRMILSAMTAGVLAAGAARAADEGWRPMFAADLSDAEFKAGVWTASNGVFTASEDEVLWSKKDYQNFVLDLDFMNGPEANSGVIVYCTDVKFWIPNAVEIQIADDFSDKWGKADKTWQCGAIFGHLAPTKSAVHKAGEWNHYTITCVGQKIEVVLNGEKVTSMDMAKWTSKDTNPDGSKIPEWLNRPYAELATKGRIGFQGKHGGAPIWFKNIRIKELPAPAK